MGPRGVRGRPERGFCVGEGLLERLLGGIDGRARGTPVVGGELGDECHQRCDLPLLAAKEGDARGIERLAGGGGMDERCTVARESVSARQEFSESGHRRTSPKEGVRKTSGGSGREVALPPHEASGSGSREQTRTDRYAAASAVRTCSAIAANAAGSLTASSARILRSISMPDFSRPLMNTLYDMSC